MPDSRPQPNEPMRATIEAGGLRATYVGGTGWSGDQWLIDRMNELMRLVRLDPLRYEPVPVYARMRSAAGTLGATFTFEPGTPPPLLHPRQMY